MMFARLALLAFSCALLFACSGAADRIAEEPTPAEAPPAPVAISEPEPAPERHFPDDSLYDLLVAEFALRRRAYDVALDAYQKQAPQLRDAGVSAHTTRLSQFLQQEEAALDAALLWVELEPTNLEALNVAAALLVNDGQPVAALSHLATIESLGGAANFPMVLSDFDNLDSATREALAQQVEALHSRFEGSVRLNLTLALLATEQQDYELALQRLETTLALEPGLHEALLVEARILTVMGDSNPYARIQQTLKQNPDDKLLRLQFARLLAATDMEGARDQFEVLAKQEPNDPDILYSLALISRELGELDAATNYLQQLIATGQRTNEAYYYLGRIEEQNAQPERALEAYRQVGNSREFIAANSRIGNILIERDDLQESRDWFADLRIRYPARLIDLYGLESETLTQYGYIDDAKELVDEALAIAPESSALLYNRAMLSEKQGDLDAMEKDLRTIIDSDPDNATALNALGYTLTNRTDRHEEALQLITKALALQPNEPAILDSMGWVLFRTGRYEEALDYLSRAYEEFPDPEVAAHLGEVLWVIGDRDMARTIWLDAAALNPDHPVLSETLRRFGLDMSGAGIDSTTPQQP
ncbi:MAG: tetratricopeptide repeat protein [Pseudomonadota bacterium]